MPDQTAAEVLAHEFDNWGLEPTLDGNRRLAAAVLGLLQEQGFSIVELPLADEHGNFLPDGGRTEVWIDHRPDGVMVNQGRRHRHSYSTPAAARRLGTALIAAADAAEANR